MYLFIRERAAKPERIADATAFAIDMAAKASTTTGLEMRAWTVDFGAPISSFSWTTTVESHADMGTAREKLMADGSYLAALEEGSELFQGSVEDHLLDIVGTAGDGGHVGGHSSIVMAQCTTGKIAEAMLFGVEMMNHVAATTGLDGIFTRSLYGQWAGVAWFSLADSLDEVQAATVALAEDPSYIERVDQAGELFLPGSGEARLTRRIA